MKIILLSVLEFTCGALMFSYWLGLLKKKNLREVGDGNPGAFNLWLSAGPALGLMGVFLDFFKGFFPVAIIIWSGTTAGPELIPVAIMPVLGHAFSPFLRFRGGKAIAVTFGVWSALTGFQVSFIYAVTLAVLAVLSRLVLRSKNLSADADAFMVVVGMLLVFIYLFVLKFPDYIIYTWLLNLAVLLYKSRKPLYSIGKKLYGSIGKKLHGKFIFKFSAGSGSANSDKNINL